MFPSHDQAQKANLDYNYNSNRPGNLIGLEVGWSVPSTIKTGLKKKSIYKQLTEQVFYQTYYLTPYDTQFTINQDGTVSLSIDYYGMLEYHQYSPANLLFYELFLEEAYSNDTKKEIEKLHRQLKNFRENSKRNKAKIEQTEKKIKEFTYLLLLLFDSRS